MNISSFILGCVVGFFIYGIMAASISHSDHSEERPPMGDKEYERKKHEAELACKIAELCDKGMSQRQIANALNIHKKTVYTYMKKYNLVKKEEKP